MALPVGPGAVRGDAVVQVQRSLPDGERTILDQYRLAIAAARRTIYIENRAPPAAAIAEALAAALARGVAVAALVPAAIGHVPLPNHLATLCRHPGFTLAGTGGPGAGPCPCQAHAGR